jgi:1,4-alpha-glucan branching enzyme
MAVLPEQVLAFAVSLMLLSPQIPMLFMGEEWASQMPFPYFCDFDDTLNSAVREGRRKELSALPGFDGDDLPDPTAHDTFCSARLDWEKVASEQGGIWVDRYRQLITLRRERVVPLLSGIKEGGRYALDAGAIRVDWPLKDGRRYVLVANPSAEAAITSLESDLFDVVYAQGDHQPDRLGPWALVFAIC